MHNKQIKSNLNSTTTNRLQTPAIFVFFLPLGDNFQIAAQTKSMTCHKTQPIFTPKIIELAIEMEIKIKNIFNIFNFSLNHIKNVVIVLRNIADEYVKSIMADTKRHSCPLRVYF